MFPLSKLGRRDLTIRELPTDDSSKSYSSQLLDASAFQVSS